MTRVSVQASAGAEAPFGVEIDEANIFVFGADTSKREALDTLIDAVADHNHIADKELFKLALYHREAVMSTGIGGGVAIPHVRFEGVPAPAVALGISREGIDYGALDNAPVHIIVLIAMPVGMEKEYLDLLAQVMLYLRAPHVRDALLKCETRDQVAGILLGRQA